MEPEACEAPPIISLQLFEYMYWLARFLVDKPCSWPPVLNSCFADVGHKILSLWEVWPCSPLIHQWSSTLCLEVTWPWGEKKKKKGNYHITNHCNVTPFTFKEASKLRTFWELMLTLTVVWEKGIFPHSTGTAALKTSTFQTLDPSLFSFSNHHSCSTVHLRLCFLKCFLPLSPKYSVWNTKFHNL